MILIIHQFSFHMRFTEESVGPYEKWYSNGGLKERLSYDETGDRLIEHWYENDQLSARICANGLCEKWYSNGNIHVRCKSINGALHGILTKYDQNGEIYMQNHYKNGTLDLKWSYVRGTNETGKVTHVIY